MKQNDRFVVVLKVSEVEAKLGHIVVEDRLPAGFEIENPQLVKGTRSEGVRLARHQDRPGAYRLPRRPVHRGVLAHQRQ